MSRTFYLGSDVLCEPLYANWYAWSHLIAPATAAMNVANSHVKIMKSYLMAPEIHANSLKNPAMRGGPFIDYQGQRVAEIEALLQSTQKRQAHIIEFGNAIKELNKLLSAEANGYSLEPLYDRIPKPLRGYVELVYDLNHNPYVRFIEGLLYRSRYYDQASQSIALSKINQDERSFAFSTPRLEDDDHLHLNIPFADPRLDEWFKLKEQPQPFEYIKEVANTDKERDTQLRSLLTEQAPQRACTYEGEGVRIRYFGHACLLIETKGVSLLTDPVLSYQYETKLHRYTYDDLPAIIDYVLITHAHADHFLLETLLQLRRRIKHIVIPRNGNGTLEDPSMKLMLQNLGFTNLIEVEEMESVGIEGGSITGIPFLGEHADLHIKSKMAHLVRLGGQSILCAADSANLDNELYRHVHEIVGDVDMLFLGMECDGAPLSWVYGQLLTKPLDRRNDQSRRLSGSDYERALAIVKQLNCKTVYVYAMGQEPWLGFITSIRYTNESKPIVESNRLIENCLTNGIPAERLFIKKDIQM
jgi:L-ascorbate metabolism protein UlaG (beta-lactamase superfamily)